jgi:3'-phosphoadenosine 5'-phosphosulfate (PAPS) 3'-phosphatase
VSAADEAANAVIVQGLSRLLPGVPVVSEEEHMKPSGLDDALFS